MSESPKVTIVIPVYNEEDILRESVTELVAGLSALEWSFTLVLAENGSTDSTVALAESLSEENDNVSYFSTGEPGNGNYGKALRAGILAADGEYVICDEIDLCDIDFYQDAVRILDEKRADLVIGSKLAAGARDERPLVRHVGSLVINTMLKLALDFKGTDTHGLKAFRRTALTDVARSCIVDRDLFASEFVIRAERAGIPIKEIPVSTREKREPSVQLFRRVPSVLKNLAKLFVAIRIKG